VQAIYFDPHVDEAGETRATRVADLATLLRTSDIVNVLAELTWKRRA
jgi:phosphoglycerate dehydrogenase-like enzyme